MPPAADALVAALPAALMVVDAEGCIAQVNAAAEMLLNASATHLRQRLLTDVLHLPDPCLQGLREEAPFAAYECTITRPAGGTLHVDFHAVPMPDHAGWRLVTLSGSTAALTSGRLDRRDQTRSAIGAAAMLAHEIKNPLAGIRGAAQLLDAQVAPDGAALTRLIREEVDRVTALIDRMEAFTDGRPRACSAQNLYPILEHARAVAAAAFGDRIVIHDAYDPSLPLVLVERDALVQVLLNLLSNAAEAAPEGRRATVTLATRYRHGVSVSTRDARRALPIEVTVADDGPGPPDEIAEHLFEPFVSSRARGRGLGLALVDKLMHDIGGLIQFAREDDRSVFRLLLPRAA